MYQPELICALCNKSTNDSGYRMLITIAICNHCVDKLIMEALGKMKILLPIMSEKVQ